MNVEPRRMAVAGANVLAVAAALAAATPVSVRVDGPSKTHTDPMEGHRYKFYPNQGKPLHSRKKKRLKGMSGRQWKKTYKAARRAVVATPGQIFDGQE